MCDERDFGTMPPVGTKGAWSGAIAAFAVALACGFGARAPVSHAAGPLTPPTTADVTVAPTPIAAPIPDDFVGLALEYSTVPRWAGWAHQGVNTVLAQLLRNLDPNGHPIIRIGGLSTDHSWWPAKGLTWPLGVTYRLTPAWARSTRRFVTAMNGRLLLGLNFEADDPAVDRAEADEFLSLIGRHWITAMNIGNEPPLYSGVPWYHELDGKAIPWFSGRGVGVFGRSPTTWDPITYASQYAAVLAALPHVPIAGPDTQRIPWMAEYGTRFLSPTSPVRIVTSHGYGLNNCITNPLSPAYPTVANMLSPFASQTLLPGLDPYIQLAHQDGAAFRIDELGSVTCNGHAGVSDTFASALWAADALFSVAQAGVDGVNLHSYPHLPNNLFDFTHASRHWTGSVHPLYYGALLFADAAPAGSRLLRVTSTGPTTLRTWATTGPGLITRVLLINDSLTSPAVASVTVPAGFNTRPAGIVRLTAPSAYATDGVKLGGRSFGDSTSTGILRSPVPQSAVPHGGVYRVTLRPATAVLLTFTR
jgi:hypothetical protein